MKFVMFVFWSSTLLIAVVCGCKGETNSEPNNVSDLELNDIEINPQDIVINEFAANAIDLNEYDKESDWIELYNTTDHDISMGSDRWTITDNPSKTEKFVLPEVIIPSKGHLILWCDGEEVYDDEIHTSFKLSSKGESIGLYYDGELIDEIVFDSLGKEYQSMGRETDGSNNWVLFEKSTISKSNNKLDIN